jgi:hypothetical protein
LSTLKTSMVPPQLVENDLGRMELRKERNRSVKVMDELQDQLIRWKNLKATKGGQVLIEVADFEIKDYEDKLSKPILGLAHFGDSQMINETRAEWRGCLAVWKSIKYNLVEKERALESLKQMFEKEEADMKKVRDEKLDKYR